MHAWAGPSGATHAQKGEGRQGVANQTMQRKASTLECKDQAARAQVYG